MRSSLPRRNVPVRSPGAISPAGDFAGRREVNPIELALFFHHIEIEFAHFAHRVQNFSGEYAGIHHTQTGSAEECAGTAHNEQALHAGTAHRLENARTVFGNESRLVGIAPSGIVGRNHGILTFGQFGDAIHVGHVGADHREAFASSDFPGIARHGRDFVTAIEEFIENCGTDEAGGADEENVL